MSKISKRLRSLRKKKELQTTELAEKARVSLGSLNKWEHEKGKTMPRIDGLIRLASELVASLDDILESLYSALIRPRVELRVFSNPDPDNTDKKFYKFFKKCNQEAGSLIMSGSGFSMKDTDNEEEATSFLDSLVLLAL